MEGAHIPGGHRHPVAQGAAGTVRPGGRTARTRARVLAAAGEILTEKGFTGLDLAQVAARAGVGRTTVHRRWGSAAALVADLLQEATARPALPRPTTGHLAADLAACALHVRHALTHPAQAALLRAAIAAATFDPPTAGALARFYRACDAAWAPLVARAVAAGELPARTDAAETVRAVCAPLAHRVVTGAVPSEQDALRAARTALAAARAGAFTR
ncbi:TetR/AcrR family transcriptional regulator [Streptomyces purpureus]|uniref:Transcriptional regulator n=1 Tax=Streptomyces purpureus TaxID=1951 RepID=A0A918LWW9_9ACTN|nr:TetR/AcrR family transcriptional regulator [Streptomyces purpureus]GGT65657.1 transcriptional regulator [Streptomyces purpureus]